MAKVETDSRQPRTSQAKDVAPFFWSILETTISDGMPKWGDQDRGKKMREFAKAEPILAGTVAVMASKATALDWQISGGRSRVRQFQDVLAEAEDGEGWSYWLDRLVQDYTVCDLGGVSELGKDGLTVTGLYNLDAVQLQLTGNVTAPIKYYPSIGNNKSIPLEPGEFFRVVDMPSAEERRFGLGFSAVSRAYKAAKVLLAVYQYEDEQLADLPPAGVASITGLTMEEVNKAFDLYEAKRDSRGQQTFKGVLWLAAQANPMTQIGVNLEPFSTIPPHFDKRQAVETYVYTLSLDFGIDVREIWPASQAGATKAEAEVQHQKAKGKGFGRMISTIERAINWEVLPDGIDFLFDMIDSQDDLLRYQVQMQAIDAVRKLWEPGSGMAPMPSQPSTNIEPAPGPQGIITTDEARQLLVENGVLPDWISATNQTVVHSVEEKALRTRVDRAQLGPGEDLVSINRAGDMITQWSSRRSYSMQLPPLLQRRPAEPPGQGDSRPDFFSTP